MGQGIVTAYAQPPSTSFGVPLEQSPIPPWATRDRAQRLRQRRLALAVHAGGSAVQGRVDTTVELPAMAGERWSAPRSDIEPGRRRVRVAGADRHRRSSTWPRQQPDGRGSPPTAPGASSHLAATAATSARWRSIRRRRGDDRAYASVDTRPHGEPAIVEGQIKAARCRASARRCASRWLRPEGGQLLSASFMDYALPRADDFADFETMLDPSIPCRTNLLGVKGVGELGTIGATPAVVDAVVDALASTGLGRQGRKIQMPLDRAVVRRRCSGIARRAASCPTADPARSASTTVCCAKNSDDRAPLRNSGPPRK